MLHSIWCAFLNLQEKDTSQTSRVQENSTEQSFSANFPHCSSVFFLVILTLGRVLLQKFLPALAHELSLWHRDLVTGIIGLIFYLLVDLKKVAVLAQQNVDFFIQMCPVQVYVLQDVQYFVNYRLILLSQNCDRITDSHNVAKIRYGRNQFICFYFAFFIDCVESKLSHPTSVKIPPFTSTSSFTRHSVVNYSATLLLKTQLFSLQIFSSLNDFCRWSTQLSVTDSLSFQILSEIVTNCRFRTWRKCHETTARAVQCRHIQSCCFLQ